jgi:hypothetical protein
MVEADRQHPLAGHVLYTAMTAAGAQVSVQVGDRLGQPSMMGSQDRPAGRRVPQAVEDRDALGRPQDHIKGRDGVAAMRATEQLPRRRVPTFEHGLEPATDASPCSPRVVAAPYHRPGLSPWPDNYCS